jgi:hypothetical protein
MLTGKIPAENLQNAYQLSYQTACKELAQQNEPQKIAARSWTHFDPEKSVFSVKYLNENYTVSYPSGEVNFADKAEVVPLPAKIVILHYLLTADETTLTGEMVSFKEIPGGMIYLAPFEGRVLGAFKAIFGKNAALLPLAGEKVGARANKYGDGAVTLDVLPKLPVTYVIWEGDEEVKANGTVLFDSSAQNFLPTEDLVVACAAGASLINKTVRTLLK